MSSAAALHDEVVAWLIRFFTPPDDRVRALAALAERPFVPTLIEELRELALNSHHLRLFFSRLHDPAWLDPLHNAGLIQLPRDHEPWAFSSFIGGGIDPVRIAAELDRLFEESTQEPMPQRLTIAREIIQSASRLGTAGHSVAEKVISKYPDDHWVQMIAVSMARDTDPADPFQVAVADAVVGNGRRSDDGHQTRTILERLAQGLTADNVADRVQIVAAKTRRLADDREMRYVVLDIAALHTDGDELREPVLILAEHLARMIPVARDLGLSTQDIVGMVEMIPGELGERVMCQVLAGADDVSREAKISHIERRIASDTATGDDRDLIVDILSSPLSLEELECWRTALGEPSPAPREDEGSGAIRDDWAKVWRWAMVLPSEVLENWEEAIAAVTAQHGEPTPASLDSRTPTSGSFTGRSPHMGQELASLSVLDAAALISGWRPSEDDDWGVSARELARELETLVKENPREWTEEPCAVVRALREPVYIDHYFRAISLKASELAERINKIMAAVELVRDERWEPAPIGRDNFQYEPDWTVVETVTVEMIGAFANENGNLAPDLDFCWQLASELVRHLPDERPGIESFEDAPEFGDALNRAINRPYGKALQAVLALAGWEHRNQGAASARLVPILDEVLAIPGAVGLELRSVLARTRPFLETVAAEWLDSRADDLFGPSRLGLMTFDQTLKWSRPTKWFYRRYQAELVNAARRGTGHAVAWQLIALLREEPSYTFDSVVAGLAPDVPALKAAAEEIASLIQNISAGDPMVDRGLEFWRYLLESPRDVVPAEALVGLGRWTFVDAIEEARWLELMDRTLALTGGAIDMAIEVADRCKEAQPSSRGLRMLRMMIGHGEPWEQHHIETVGVEALRTASRSPVDDQFFLLRTRLLDRGRHEAAEISPES